jgi:L-alanine-DL-glutamate epimerase-like enolase superfamily enzyme
MRNFMMTGTNFGNWPVHEEYIEEYIKENPVIKDGLLKVTYRPGLGVTENEAALKESCMPGEPWMD